jgi:hypothetical protein
MRPRLLLPVLALAVALALSACGKQGESRVGSTEAAYLDLEGMLYQVQISRELTPADPEDRGYLIGADEKSVRPDESWFGVFMRVQNDGNRPLPSARDFELHDTQGNTWRPIALPADNMYAYRSVTVPPDKVVPLPDSPAGQSTIQGSLLLFKVPYANFQNRPLVLKVFDPVNPAQSAEVDLDV